VGTPRGSKAITGQPKGIQTKQAYGTRLIICSDSSLLTTGLMAFRQARQLAECQKRANVKHEFTAPPPSASQLELAEWVKFPEKYAGFRSFWSSLGGVGQISREICRFSVLKAAFNRRAVTALGFGSLFRSTCGSYSLSVVKGHAITMDELAKSGRIGKWRALRAWGHCR
jgi:hypothetical protein